MDGPRWAPDSAPQEKDSSFAKDPLTQLPPDPGKPEVTPVKLKLKSRCEAELDLLD